MTGRLGVWPEPTARLFRDVAIRLAESDPAALAARVRRLVDEHDAWRRSCINLLGADGVMSRAARSVLDSDMASRVFEGLPGDRDLSTGPAIAARWCDEIEADVVALAQQLFHGPFVEWRAVSTSMATAIVLKALCEPGDLVAVQSMSAGANISYHPPGVIGVLGLRTVDLPGTSDFGIDVDGAAEAIRRERPRCIVVGGTKVLFRYPLAELRELAEEVGAHLVFDAAHVGPFIYARTFNDPLAEGADVLVTGTHKIMGGPVGGLIVSREAELAMRIEREVWPGFLQTRDQNKFAAAAIALAEMLAFGRQYARAVLDNGRALGEALVARGIRAVGSERGFTETHQVIADFGDPRAKALAARCSDAGLLMAHTNIFGEPKSDIAASGVRMSVAQLTRLGMGQDEMEQIVDLVLRAEADDSAVPAEVEALAGAHTQVHYSFD
jgi:glycine hydroxymethyltransferase